MELLARFSGRANMRVCFNIPAQACNQTALIRYQGEMLLPKHIVYIRQKKDAHANTSSVIAYLLLYVSTHLLKVREDKIMG